MFVFAFQTISTWVPGWQCVNILTHKWRPFQFFTSLSLTHSSILILWSKDTDQAQHQLALCSLLAFLVIDSQNPAVRIVSMDLFFDFAFILCFFLGGPFVSSIGQWQRMHQIIQVYKLTFQALKAKMLNMHKHAFYTCLLWGHSNGNQWDQQMELQDDSWYLVLGSFGSNLGRVLSQWSVEKNRGILGRWGYPNSNSCPKCVELL